MDIDFTFDNELVLVGEKDSQKEKQKRRRRSMQGAMDNMRKCAIDRITGKMGEC